jgi:cytoskeletal protein CcmA (bactofilin family)
MVSAKFLRRTMIFRRKTAADTLPPSLVDGVVVLRGTLGYGASGVIHGRIDGSIQGDAPLILAADADVRGSVHSGPLTIHGRVEGVLHSTGTAELNPSATVRGPLRATGLEIHDGAQYQGTATIQPNTP